MAGTTEVVIVGAGFAGVACARRLAAEPRARVTLVDRNGYHQFQPLLYQIATAELAPRDIRFDLHEMFARHASVRTRTGEVVAIDPHSPSVTFADDSMLAADVLVLGAGAQPNFFHTPGAEQHTVPLYSLTDAERVRGRILELFRDAAAKPELAADGALTFVVVGGGPTGVETAGALAEIVHDVMPHVYPHLAIAGARVILVDLGHTVLTAFSDDAHSYAVQQLTRRGVELRLGVSVKEVTPDGVTLSDGTTIKTRLVVWGGGQSAAPLASRSGLPQGRGGRIDVQPDLSVAGFPKVYALGDVANIPGADGEALPQLGSVAQQAGDWAAGNIIADLEGDRRQPFHYRDKGIMAMIGRKAAVAEIGPHRHELKGRFAFAAWLGVHAQLLANAGAEMRAFVSWLDDFYVRPAHRSAELLDPATIDRPRIRLEGTHDGTEHAG
ncbi:putative pyridine nucleotide-disulfide oxidoreductase [Actinoplanes missouriensis 431]|uniref:NADH:ubiquinone reductase (non-electrogenic) n=1 Tax=Actinoplanes missouriensis (strain ATCC 14538 / DSM 43046 / CBS 188.64 / JCM 3121 / NBRC 102363 / NCIMB 12654 / NRRL B-3342 / UNCC 431) TaxID=512565 RepID=I0H676_ACTM4|nr:NAD(P)/FAD-dependent oxidoreductase [Actinoplanes missouriensis]BAL88513.1 putative pyridine nucleotide-disulfide oxidoreductase [Actinoplanes missouriensis 431]